MWLYMVHNILEMDMFFRLKKQKKKSDGKVDDLAFQLKTILIVKTN